MIDKIKTKLIHWLGGYTEAEQRENGREAYGIGVQTMLYNLKVFADRLNGLPADDWCKKMYERLEQGIQRREEGTHSH